MRFNPRAALLAVVGIACASWASAQSQVGAEFHVNTTIPQSQIKSRVAVDGSGRFTIVWQDGHTDSSSRIAMQRYAADGTPFGTETAVCTTAANGNFDPDISSDASGNFIVVWNGVGPSGSGIQSRRFSSSGIGSGPIFRLNSYTGANFYTPAVAVAPGGAVAVWPNDQRGTIDARVIPAGQPTGFEFAVSATTGGLRDPSIAYLPGVNRYVVTWEPQTGPSIYKVFARFVDPGAQAPVGSEFLVSSAGNVNQALPHVAARANGDFVVVWQEGGNPSLRLRRFLADGTPVGNDLAVPNANNIGRPRIAMTEQGDFVVTWSQTDNQVHAQRFDAAANLIGIPFVVSTTTGVVNNRPAVATRGTGDFVITWDSNHDSDGSYGVFGQRFATLRPAGLVVDDASGSGNHNLVWDRNEANARVAPSWTNFTPSSQFPSGTLSALTCPTGLTCSISDASASYTITSGATAPCGSPNGCYAVTNSVAGIPALHADATAVETLSTGEQKTWRLHIGGGFTDVTSASPYYRFVETLLHRNVTGGCTGSTYCPTSPTTRQQIAIFLLVSKEGTGYAPPPCVPPNVFTDVPETSPYCAWIEELVARGVVGGCSPTTYCPNDPVTRDQMALFVLKTLDPNLAPPACTVPPFADVPISNPFCPWIKEAAARNIVGGCGGGNYCPTGQVTRDQMAVFLVATFGLTLYGAN